MKLPVGARPRTAGDFQEAPWWRAPSTGARVIAFISGSGGTGVTTTATGTGLALVAAGSTALVDVGTGHASGGWRLETALGPVLADVVRPGWRGPATGPPGGLTTIDGGGAPLEPQLMRTALGVVSGAYATTLLDIGNDVSRAATTALAEADRAVLVTSLSHTALDAAAATIDRLARTAPAQARDLVVAVVLTRRQPVARVDRHLRDHLPEGAGGWVVVPYDGAAARDNPLDPLRLRSRTRAAYDRLAGLLSTSRPAM
ncbi:hypothetical protein ABZS66_51075 [Dactylosporangium sp. NPDC005572]|uniref:MinD/ParA family ATP-binding protein n=1 Tax=Dactylosporangium sp. NPDC005572 TaxID=3156889 RepID=UPI0033A5B95D